MKFRTRARQWKSRLTAGWWATFNAGGASVLASREQFKAWRSSNDSSVASPHQRSPLLTAGVFLALFISLNGYAIPDPPVLISPGSNAVNIGTSPVLKTGVSEPSNAEVKAAFYGRKAAATPGRDFSLMVLPDTQYYVSSKNGGLPGMFYAQMDWIVSNRTSLNIAYVAHLGDVVEDGDTNAGPNNLAQWRNATNALYRLEKSGGLLFPNGTPYGVAVGNHDQSPNQNAGGTTTYYNQFFGSSRFSGRPYYGGHYGTNNDNHFDLFSASGMDFVVVYLEYDTNANPAVLTWANNVLQTNSNRRAIIVSHYLIGNGDQSDFRAQGQATYTALKTNGNIFLMLCGHVGDNGEGSRVDTFNGNTITTLLSDYQSRTNGGNGLMRWLEFSPSNNVVRVKTYSPWLNQFETDADSQFTVAYTMQSAGTFMAIGTNDNISSGSTTSLVWPGLQVNSTYEWYVKVTDALNNSIIGPTWRFTTGSANSPPTASNEIFNVAADFPTNLVLTATDPNSDALTFALDSLPTNGLALNFDPTNVMVSYVPAHGFTGTDTFDFHVSDAQSSSATANVTLNVVAGADTNGNGLPDLWETAYGINDPNADPDGDGQNNRQEYLANTNPTNAASVLAITSAAINTNGQFVVTWSSIGGTRYRIQYADGNSDGDWTGSFTDFVRATTNEIDPSPIGTGSTQTFTDAIMPTNRGRYYRVKITK